jgi:glycosyltransferase involved in cell wall biosynthesis
MMAAYNAERYIGDALASLLRQRDDANLDIIVVNDGSTDGTAEIVRRIAAEAPEVRLIETPNQGVTRTRNVLLRALAPDTNLVTTLDADDLSPAGRFVRDLRAFHADPSLELQYGAAQLFRNTGEDRLAPNPSEPVVDVRGVILAAGLYGYALVGKVGLFDESFAQAEDMDFLLRLFEQQPRYQITDNVSMYYRRHPGNMTRDAATLQRGFARALMYSVRRRKQFGTPSLPKGIFDPKTMGEAANW